MPFPLESEKKTSIYVHMPPTAFQRRMLWAAITALSFVAIGGVIFFAGWMVISAISFLQAVITPIAIAAIIAYLVEPVVRYLEKWRISRTLAVILVFLGFIAVGAAVVIGVVPSVLSQANSFRANIPEYSKKAEALVHQTIENVQRWTELPMFRKTPPPAEHTPEGDSTIVTPEPNATGYPAPATSPTPANSTSASDLIAENMSKVVSEATIWLTNSLPKLGNNTWSLIQRGLGFFGFLLSLVLVPIFLFFFLQEGPAIAANWSNYLPLRASPLKSELVSLLSEINSYLINFFRGQLMVSMIDGVLIAISLLVMGLDFALLIGLLVGILGLIPYAGMMITWIPAVLIAAAQFSDWGHPLAVTIIFIVANNIDGMIIAPKIVGESVGLHPLTVIISVLAWSLILGGILGALLAVPLTATLKVLLKRYFWDRPTETNPEAAH
ncbi:AI-2E family transporter [soil metagenome]